MIAVVTRIPPSVLVKMSDSARTVSLPPSPAPLSRSTLVRARERATNPGHPALFCLGGFAPPRRWNSPLAESTIKSCWAQVTTEGKRGRQTGGRLGGERDRERGRVPPLLPRLPSSSTSSSALWWAGCTGWLAGSPWRVTQLGACSQPALPSLELLLPPPPPL